MTNISFISYVLSVKRNWL